MGWKPLFSLCLLGVAAACHESSSPPSPTSTATTAEKICDPLQPEPTPITLGSVVACGRAADGTIYLVDSPNGLNAGSHRLFVGNGGVLQRVNVGGEGSSGDFIGISGGALSLRIDLQNGKATAFFVSKDPPSEGEKVISSGGGETLTLLPESDARGFTLKNLVNVSLIADATTSDGRRLIAFSQDTDQGTYLRRVFFGTGSRLIERKTSQDGGARSGFSLVFDVDGVETTASFPTIFGPSEGQQSTLYTVTTETNPGSSTALTTVEGAPGYGNDQGQQHFDPDGGAITPAPAPLKPAAELTAGFTFVCF